MSAVLKIAFAVFVLGVAIALLVDRELGSPPVLAGALIFIVVARWGDVQRDLDEARD